MRRQLNNNHHLIEISERDGPNVVDNVYSLEMSSSRGSDLPHNYNDPKSEYKPVVNTFHSVQVSGGKMKCKRNRHLSETIIPQCVLLKLAMKCCTWTISIFAVPCAGDTKCVRPSFQISKSSPNISIRKAMIRRRAPSLRLPFSLLIAVCLLVSNRAVPSVVALFDTQIGNFVEVERMLNNNTAVPSISISNVTDMPTIQDTTLQPSFMPSGKPSISSTPPTETQSNSPTISLFPSLVPSVKPSVSLQPSLQPSIRPSTHPTSEPSKILTAWPSQLPSNIPTKLEQPSKVPSQYPSISFQPSNMPSLSHQPSTYPSSQPSILPSSNPVVVTTQPSRSPTLTPTHRPSITPSQSVQPSNFPSTRPSAFPTWKPTITAVPSEYPTFKPTSTPRISLAPSSQPSWSPTVAPTFSNEIVSKATFIQLYIASTPLEEGTLEARWFEEVMVSFTPEITTDDTSRVTTICEFLEGRFAGGRKLRSRFLQSGVLVTYNMEYRSIHTNVTDYDQLFKTWMNENLNTVVNRLKLANVDIEGAQQAFILGETMAPTMFPSGVPSHIPSMYPSKEPSTAPSVFPSWKPSAVPSHLPSDTPSRSPTNQPSTIPSSAPSISKDGSNTVTIAAVAGTIGAGALIVFAGFCFRRRRRQEGLTDRATSPLPRLMPRLRSPFHHNVSGLSSETNGVNINTIVGDRRENESIVSEESLISTGSSRENDSDSDIDYNDDTYNLADEFDKYKDQNLEKMRSEVEGMSSNFDGMMSQALTKALMDDMDEDDGGISVVTSDMANSMEIEATVLCDINDWLKKKEGATPDEKREFMQETLNEMVSKVRRGIVSPEDASRTIHLSAAMLGLQLAESLPETTLIVTGMRKQVTKEHVIKAFREFGEIESAAVSSKQRGFGVVRYRSPKSVQNAMDRFRYGEIVVQDVGVMIRILKAEKA